jgi:hypothetical protein
VWLFRFSKAKPKGQVKKLQRRRQVMKVERMMLWGGFELRKSWLKAAGLTGRLNTVFIERLNLTLRQGVALLTRRTWGTAQQMSALALHVEGWRVHYHFARYREALRAEGLFLFVGSGSRLLPLPPTDSSDTCTAIANENDPEARYNLRILKPPIGAAHASIYADRNAGKVTAR